MKHLLCLLILSNIFISSSSQTLHLERGRTGSLDSSPLGQDRFGAVYMPIVTMERVVNLGDTAALVHFAKDGRLYEYYRTSHHPVFNDKRIGLKELKARFPEVKDWVGFEQRPSDREKRDHIMPFSFPKGPMTVALFGLLFLMGSYILLHRHSLGYAAQG